MLYIDRLSEIKQMLLKQESVTVTELSQRFGVSGETIRRDLEKMRSTDKRIKKIHGGAYYEHPEIDMPYNARVMAVVEGKQHIAESCISFVENGDIIILDSSTTALSLANALVKSELHVTVITNGLNIMECVEKSKNIELIGIGGKYSANSRAFLGGQTTAALKLLHADKAFISCSGLNSEYGATDSSEEMASIRRMMLRQARNRYLVADSNKIGRTKLHKIADLELLHAVFTDKTLPHQEMENFTKLGVRVYVNTGDSAPPPTKGVVEN